MIDQPNEVPMLGLMLFSAFVLVSFMVLAKVVANAQVEPVFDAAEWG